MYCTVPPYRETRSYVARIRSNSGTDGAGPATRLYRSVQVVNGEEHVRYTNKPIAGATVVPAIGPR